MSSQLSAFEDRFEAIHGSLSSSVYSFAGDDPAAKSASQRPPVLTIDDICSERGIDVLGAFRMNIKDADFGALRGAEGMLARGAIRFLVVRVKFIRLEDDVPEFGAVAEYLRRFGYEIQGLNEGYRDQSIVLHGAEVSFVAPQLQERPGFSLSPTIPTERIETIDGRRLPDVFLRNARLQKGAAIRAQSANGQEHPRSDRWPQVPTETGWAMNAIIDATPEPHGYSLKFDTDEAARREFQAGELIVAEVAIKVVVGKVGILWVGRDGQPLTDRERHVSEMPGVQRVLVSAPAEQVQGLAFRNVSSAFTKATFKVMTIRTKIASRSFRGALHASGAEALYLAGCAAEQAGNGEEAARLFAEAAALVPEHTPALESLGQMLDATGIPDLARAKYDKARKARTDGDERAADRSFVLRRQGPFTDQLAAYNSVLRTIKDRTLPYIARGNAFLAEGRGEAALADYESALKLKAQPEVAALKGEALSMLGRYQEAVEAFDLAVAERPRDPDALSGRAIALLGMGKLEAADSDWRRQLELLPPVRASARACVALRLADYEASLRELERLLANGPGKAYWRLYHITALHRLGRPRPSVDTSEPDGWPGLLLSLHSGQLGADEVLEKADTPSRRIEALFQLGVLAFPRDRAEALKWWMAVVDQCRPDLIEYSAARHELARMRS
jgi:tetratricopeptide (TPR) repeat protein